MDPIAVDLPAAAKPADPKPDAAPFGLLGWATSFTRKQAVGAAVAALSLCAGVAVVKYSTPAPAERPSANLTTTTTETAKGPPTTETAKAPPVPHGPPGLGQQTMLPGVPAVPNHPGQVVAPQLLPPDPTPLPEYKWCVIAPPSVEYPLGRIGRGAALDDRCFRKASAWDLPYIPIAYLPPQLALDPRPAPSPLLPDAAILPAGGIPPTALSPPGGAALPQVPDLTNKLPTAPTAPGPQPLLPKAPDLGSPGGVAKVEPLVPLLPTPTPLSPPATTKVELPVVPALGPTPAAPTTPMVPALGPTPTTPSLAPVTPALPAPPTVTQVPAPPTAVFGTPVTPPPPALVPAPPSLTPTEPVLTPTPPALTPTAPALTPTPPALTPTGVPTPPLVTPTAGVRAPEATARAPQTTFDVDIHDPKAGDTYESISKAFYNDARYAGALAAYNRNRPLTAGSVDVPPVHVLRQRHGQLVGATSATEPTPTFRASGRRFVVPAGGTTLHAVAQRTLGSSARWREIYDLNPGVNPDSVPAGTDLRLPLDAVP